MPLEWVGGLRLRHRRVEIELHGDANREEYFAAKMRV